jgi:RNA polymerase sigma factor (sigma-70 family)
MDFNKTFEQCLPIVDKLASRQCRKYGFSREEVEDFTQEVSKKIWSNDCAVLRQWQGRSKLATYLGAVVSKALKDHVDHLWGKWRPSASAAELGDVAIELERLLVRDRRTLDEACRILRVDRKIPLSEQELAGLAAQLRSRPYWGRNRQDSGGDAAGRAAAGLSSPVYPLATPPESAEDRVLRLERAALHEKVFTALESAMAALPDEDQVIVRCKIWKEWKTVDIAHHLGLEQKRLYTRLIAILNRLRQEMQRLGIGADDIGEILRDADS